MSSLIICPDCGGIVGGSPDDGKVCTCFGHGHDEAAPVAVSEPRISGLDDSAAPRSAGSSAASKICCKCGTDVSRKKRFRDASGYWCAECHRADAKTSGLRVFTCDSCSRRFAKEKLIQFGDEMICNACHNERLKKAQKKAKKLRAEEGYREHEWGRLFKLLAILIVLLIIMIWSYFFRH